MEPVVTRAIEERDMECVSSLLDEALGRGFWSLDRTSPGRHILAETEGIVAGVASSCLVEGIEQAPDLSPPVGLVRLVAVAPAFRRRGIASRLVRESCGECGRLGAVDMASFAWVHGRTGGAPLAGVLERLGFERLRRIEGFYGGGGVGPCPGCGRTPCVCSADLYVIGKRGRPPVPG